MSGIAISTALSVVSNKYRYEMRGGKAGKEQFAASRDPEED